MNCTRTRPLLCAAHRDAWGCSGGRWGCQVPLLSTREPHARLQEVTESLLQDFPGILCVWDLALGTLGERRQTGMGWVQLHLSLASLWHLGCALLQFPASLSSCSAGDRKITLLSVHWSREETSPGIHGPEVVQHGQD